jgi:hypothetical protein
MANMFHKFGFGIRIGSVADTTARDALTNVDAGSLIWVVSESAFHQYNGSSWSAIAGAGSNTFADDVFRIQDNGDATKQIAFQASGITTATTRTITMPDANVDLGALTNSNIDASAAIARTKLASGTANHVLINSGTGVMTSEAALAASRGGLGTDASAFSGVVKASGGSFSAASVVNADIDAAAAIAYSKLSLSGSIVNADINASAAIAYSKLSLSGSIVNADINASAAIAYSKLSLAGSIVNADINASAAIAESKLSLDYSTSSLNTAIGNKANDADVIKKNGSVTYTANQPMGGFKVTGLGAPSAASDAATKGYVDSVAEGLKPKTAVRVATAAAGTLATSFENGDTVDDVVLATGDRILIKNQAAAEDNGIYVVNASGAPTRATDFDSLSPIDEINGAMVAVQEGTANAGKIFVQYGAVATIGTDPINFTFFNSSAALVGGDGITVSGSNISVDHDGQGLQFTANQLALELDGSTLSKSASGLKVASGGITDTEINASAAIAYSKLSLSGSIVNADVSASAAIAYSKLSLSGSIVNADIASGAAIAESKLSLDYSTSSLNTNKADKNSAGDQTLQANSGSNPFLIQSSLWRRAKGTAADFVEEEYVHSTSLSAAGPAAIGGAFTCAVATYESVVVEYHMKEDTTSRVRTGVLRVDSDGTNITYTDLFNETADVGITLTADIDSGNLRILAAKAGNNVTMRADIRRYKAI